jgi:hypothetical protein
MCAQPFFAASTNGLRGGDVDEWGIITEQDARKFARTGSMDMLLLFGSVRWRQRDAA